MTILARISFRALPNLVSQLSALSPLSLLLALFALSACSSQPASPEQDGASVESRTPAAISVTAPEKNQGGEEVRTVQPDQSPEAMELAALKNPASPLSKRSVFFDYDSFVVRDEYKPLIIEHARFLSRHPEVKMLIQGNADDRGSREYNLALGQKRADAVQRVLTLLGASAEQLQSVSLGEEKPVCEEADEHCWSRNRRSDMLYSGEF